MRKNEGLNFNIISDLKTYVSIYYKVGSRLLGVGAIVIASGVTTVPEIKLTAFFFYHSLLFLKVSFCRLKKCCLLENLRVRSRPNAWVVTTE